MKEELISLLEQLMDKAEKVEHEKVMQGNVDDLSFFSACVHSKKSTMPYVTKSGDTRVLFIPGGEGRMNTIIEIDVKTPVLGWTSAEKSIMLVSDGRQVRSDKRIKVNVKGKVRSLYRNTDFDSRSTYYEQLLNQVKLFLQDLTAQETITHDYDATKAVGEI